LLVNKTLKNKEIRRVGRGVYTFHDDITVAGFAYRPFYYGMEDALTYRNMWTQMSNPVVMTSLNVREGVRKFDGANYIVKRISPKFFFGFDIIKYYDYWIPVSDNEKTLIDLIYYKHGIRKEVLGPLTTSINKQKLEEYLKQYGSRFRKRVRATLQESKQQANQSDS
jgi:predicted transcriptional regulator of viral defense system